MSDLLVSYAALILADAEIEITSDKLTTLVKAAGASVEQVWADVFAQALEGKDLKELLLSAAAAPAAGSAPAAAAGGASEAAAEEAAEEEEEESDDDMGFGLFD